MDGLGSPESMMEHSMLDLKNSSPYACYSSPKLSYDAFTSNRGKYLFNRTSLPYFEVKLSCVFFMFAYRKYSL